MPISKKSNFALTGRLRVQRSILYAYLTINLLNLPELKKTFW